MLANPVCPTCRQPLVEQSNSVECPACKVRYPYVEGILSFLSRDASFNPTAFKEKQEKAWSASARLRDRVRNSRFLSLLNWMRIKLSVSGRRDRIFYNEMHGGSPNRLILDVGCGGGRHYFADYGKVVGIDPVLDLLGIAKTIYSEVYHGSAFALPFADGTFDYVVSSDVIGHIQTEDKDRMFAEMYRVLRPGGRTVHVIETDSTNLWLSFAHRYPELFQRYFVEVPGHISLEMPSALRARFLRHGFKEVRFEKFSSTIQECGTIYGCFNNEFKEKHLGVKLAVAVDRLFSRNLLTAEAANLLLEPVARICDWMTPFDSASGALVVYEK